MLGALKNVACGINVPWKRGKRLPWAVISILFRIVQPDAVLQSDVCTKPWCNYSPLIESSENWGWCALLTLCRNVDGAGLSMWWSWNLVHWMISRGCSWHALLKSASISFCLVHIQRQVFDCTSLPDCCSNWSNSPCLCHQRIWWCGIAAHLWVSSMNSQGLNTQSWGLLCSVWWC